MPSIKKQKLLHCLSSQKANLGVMAASGYDDALTESRAEDCWQSCAPALDSLLPSDGAFHDCW